MARCERCKALIVLGGSNLDGVRYCSDRCLQEDALGRLAQEVPADLVEQYIRDVHEGPCPQCQGPGPVDLHLSHRVYSILLMTSWSSRPQLCCTRCGQKAKLLDALFCLVLGWWGLPWGLIITPIQILRNLFGLIASPNPLEPSAALRQVLQMELASRLAKAQREPAAEMVKTEG